MAIDFALFGSHVAFGRSRSGSLWVVTGIEAAGAQSFGRALAASGCEVVRGGCHLQSRRCWLAFTAPESVVLSLASQLPLAGGSRKHRLLAA